MSKVTVAAIQMECGWDKEKNIRQMCDWVKQAATAGANIILPQELFSTPYFCKDQNPDYFDLAEPLEESVAVATLMALAKKLKVVIPISFFERANKAYYNSVAVIDADGEFLGVYRKTHIPDGPGYQEKFYFNPGDTGFQVWPTKFGTIGVGICWDQWFPETARAMALMGAELLFYPTAIGSEPQDSTIDSRHHWRRVMQGHAGANLMPVIASNRIGKEEGDSCSINFYGTSFIAGPEGEIIKDMDDHTPGFITTEFDLDKLAQKRRSWGVFRDRRPSHYEVLLTADGG